MTWSVATASLVLGLLMSTKAMGKDPGFPWLLDLHRFFSGLAFGFLGLHLVTLWADSYVTFGWTEIFVPFESEWRAGAVAWGILAMYLMAAVEFSSLLKDRLPERLWHGIHLSSFAVLVFGTIHAWQAGSDVHNPIVLACGLASLTLVVGLVVLRIALVRKRPSVSSEAGDRREMLRNARAKAESGSADSVHSVKSRWLEASGKK